MKDFKSCKKCVYYCQKSKSCDLHQLPDPVEPNDNCYRFVADHGSQAEQNIEWIKEANKPVKSVCMEHLMKLKLQIIDLHNQVAESNLKSQQLTEMIKSIIEECYEEKDVAQQKP